MTRENSLQSRQGRVQILDLIYCLYDHQERNAGEEKERTSSESTQVKGLDHGLACIDLYIAGHDLTYGSMKDIQSLCMKKHKIQKQIKNIKLDVLESPRNFVLDLWNVDSLLNF